jgi:hypothetical protein
VAEGTRLRLLGPQGRGLSFEVVDGRLRAGAVLLAGRAPTDLSAQPGAIRALVATTAGARTPVAASEVAARVADHVERHGGWSPEGPRRGELATVLLGGAFPLAGSAMARGAGPIEEVPRWAVATLREPAAVDAARSLVGTRATRPVVAALARSLVPPPEATIALMPLGFAAMAADVLEPDRLAAVLRATDRHHPPSSWPGTDAVSLVRAAAPTLGATRLERMVLDAAAIADGPARLVETVRMWRSVHHLLHGRIPTRLAEVARCCRAAMPTDPVDRPSLVRGWTPPSTAVATVVEPDAAPAPAAARRRPAARRGAVHGIAARFADPPVAVPAPPPLAAHHQPRLAPAGPSAPVPATTAVPRHAAARAVDGLSIDSYTLRVPRTARDLQTWGDRLGNCLATYTAAVVDGRSTIVGVFRDQRIVACIEIDRDRRVRQFLGRANTRPDPALEARVLPVLRRHGLVAA